MIDTVVLNLPEEDFTITDYDRFSPSVENIFHPPYLKCSGGNMFKAVNNPTLKDKESYGYMPRITLYKAIRKGGYKVFIRVEFSVPKLLYGNNFDEVEESDFDKVCQSLESKLQLLGIRVKDIQLITHAKISAIHYSKNIILSDYSTPHLYIKMFRKADINLAYDMTKTDYQNEGDVVKYRGNSFEVTMYDKLMDLKRAKVSDKRAVSKDNYSQLALFDKYQMKKPFEVLRLEVRIGNARRMKKLMKKYRMEAVKYNFKSLFRKKISQIILWSITVELEESYPRILRIEETSLENKILLLQVNNPNIKYSKLLRLMGATHIIEAIGVREFRKLTSSYSDYSWYRLKKELNGLNVDTTLEAFEIVKMAIRSSRPVKIEEYKNRSV